MKSNPCMRGEGSTRTYYERCIFWKFLKYELNDQQDDRRITKLLTISNLHFTYSSVYLKYIPSF